MQCVACEDSPKAPNIPCAVCEARPARTDKEIVDQTVEIARKVLEIMGGYLAPDDWKPWEDESQRGDAAWRHACDIQELMTGSDVFSAVANMLADEDDELHSNPLYGVF